MSADFVKYICDCYSRSCFQARNEWMVNLGGTKNTMDYAKKLGVPIVSIAG